MRRAESSPTNEFERLGERVADALGGVSDERFEGVRNAFMNRASRAGVRRAKQLLWTLGGLTLALALVASMAWGYERWASARAETPTTAEDLWLEGPKHGAPTRVELGGGAHVDLLAGTRCRVHRLGDGRTRVTLEGGVIEVMVGEIDSDTWSFYAGPYLVKTVGGEFYLNYQAVQGAIQAGVTSGRLRLSGGPLGTDSVTLEAGQRLSAVEGSVEVNRLDDPPEIP